MDSETLNKERKYMIDKRVLELRAAGVLTSMGEAMSLAAIGRTLKPPVSRVAIYLVRDGRSMSGRIRRAIEKELGQSYWMLKKDR